MTRLVTCCVMVVVAGLAAATYAMQAMLAVFDFPGWSTDDDHLEPSLDIDWVAGSPVPTMH